jgi:hypothetical protein
MAQSTVEGRAKAQVGEEDLRLGLAVLEIRFKNKVGVVRSDETNRNVLSGANAVRAGIEVPGLLLLYHKMRNRVETRGQVDVDGRAIYICGVGIESVKAGQGGFSGAIVGVSTNGAIEPDVSSAYSYPSVA